MTDIARDRLGAPIQALEIGTRATVSIGASNVQTPALNAGVYRLCSSVDCYVSYGTNPTAVVGSTYLPAGGVEYFKVSSGMRFGVIQVTGTGFLSYTEML